MAARLKSSVLRREERGFGSISMARMISSGMFGGVAFLGMQLIGLRLLMIPAGLIAFVAGLIFTSGRHGIPLYRHLIITIKARFLLAVEADKQGFAAQTARFLDLDADALILDASKLLTAPILSQEDGGLDEWEIVTDSGYSIGFELVTDTLNLEEDWD